MIELIADVKQRKPIQVYMDDLDVGVYNWNEEKKRYEGSIGSLTLNDINNILKLKIEHIKVRSIKK